MNEHDSARYSARLELIEQGVLVKKKFPDGLVKLLEPGSTGEYYGLTEEFTKDFLDSALKIINSNAKNHAKGNFDIIMKRVNSYPDELQQQQIVKEIENLLKIISPYVLDEESYRSMVIDLYTETDYLDFFKGNKVKYLNKGVLEEIEASANERTVQMLKATYGKVSPNQRIKGLKKTKPLRWLGNSEEELLKLYKMLIKKQFIDARTKIETFLSILSGQQESFGQVYWNGSNRSLAHLLDLSYQNQKWQSILGNGEWFVNAQGKVLNNRDFAVAKNNKGQSKESEKIENILKAIKIP